MTRSHLSALAQALVDEGVPGPLPLLDRRAVDVVRLARALSAEVIVDQGMLHEGRTNWRKGRPVIRIRSPRVDGVRVRFTIAHEIGHVLVDRFRTWPELRGYSPGSWELERLCDEVAGSLLLPEHYVDAVIGARRPTIERIRTLALRSRTSLSAASVRLRRLGRPVRILNFRLAHGRPLRLNSSVGFRREALSDLTLLTQPGYLLAADLHRELPTRLVVGCGAPECVHEMDGTARRTPYTVVFLAEMIDARRITMSADLCSARRTSHIVHAGPRRF